MGSIIFLNILAWAGFLFILIFDIYEALVYHWSFFNLVVSRPLSIICPLVYFADALLISWTEKLVEEQRQFDAVLALEVSI